MEQTCFITLFTYPLMIHEHLLSHASPSVSHFSVSNDVFFPLKHAVEIWGHNASPT